MKESRVGRRRRRCPCPPSRAICGLFQLSAPTEPEYLLRLRGLDASRRYRVTFDNSSQSCEANGFALMKQGLTVRLEGALTSELLIFNATDWPIPDTINNNREG